MSLDRVIRFNGSVPTLPELRLVARDYLKASVAVVSDFDSDAVRFHVTLWGYCSHPLRTVAADLPIHGPKAFDKDPPARSFEVFRDDDHVVVITRWSDDLTNAVAERYAEIIARWWKGTVTT